MWVKLQTSDGTFHKDQWLNSLEVKKWEQGMQLLQKTLSTVDITDFLCGFMLIIIRNFIQLIKISSVNVASRV